MTPQRIITAREQYEMLSPWRVAEQLRLPFTTKLYRGLNLDTTAPGLEKVHAILHPPGDPPDHHPGWDHPAIGGHLLDWIDKAKGGLGGHWTADPAQAEQFARWPNEDTGRGGNLQAVIEADWGGEGADPHRTDTHEFSPSGERIRSFPQERETTLSPGAQLGISGVKIRPYDDNYWNNPTTGDEPADENHDGPWHHVLSESSMRQASLAPWRVAALPPPYKDQWNSGETAHYEYHCLQSPESGDYHLWQRSHQPVKVLGLSPNADDFSDEVPTIGERAENGTPNVYRVKFPDDHEDDAWEDELLTHPGHFNPRHNPPTITSSLTPRRVAVPIKDIIPSDYEIPS